MGRAGDICRRLRDLKDLKDLKDPNSLLSRLLRAMWSPLGVKKRNLSIFNCKECKCGKYIEYICKIYVHIPMRF